MPTLHRVIVRPIVTEATSAAYQDRGEYYFEVAPDANKQEIRQAVEKLFSVKVKSVNTLRTGGKARRRGYAIGSTPKWKKAMVTLREGQIEIL